MLKALPVSIGWVMFWKALVVTVWAVLVERWQAAKRKRQSSGIEMRYNKRSNTYVEYCPYQRAEKRLRLAVWIVGVPLALYALLAVYLLVTG